MKWLILLLILCLYASLSPFLDLQITRYFFVDNHFSEHPFFTLLYKYGERPAQLFVIAALFFLPKQRLYLALTLIVGAFLINEVALKNHWGRPRPKQVIEFGGRQPFRPFYAPNFFSQPEPSKSFPCGHCTAGYYFFCLYFLGRRLKKPWLCQGGLLFALLFGSLIGLARIAQGGHFFTDVLFGALVMYFTAKTLDIYLYERTHQAAS